MLSERPILASMTACLYFDAPRKAPLFNVPNFTYFTEYFTTVCCKYRPSPEEMKVLQKINQRIIYSYTAGTFLMALPGVLGKGCWVRRLCPRPPSQSVLLHSAKPR